MADDLIQQFSDSWGQAILLWQRLRRPILINHQLTPTDKRILYGLYRHGPCSKKALAKYIVLEHSSLTRSLDRLQQQKFISRSISLTDNRCIELSLTAAGRRKVLSVKKQSLMQLKKVQSGISSPQLQQSTALMDQLRINMAEILDDE